MVTTAPETPDTERAPALPNTESNGVLAMTAIKFRIPADQIAKAVADLPDDQRQAIKWFAGHCRSKNYGKEEISTLLKKPDGSYYSFDSAYQVLTGRRQIAGNSIAPFVTAIESYRRLVEERDEQVKSGFIETRLSGLMWSVCRKARLRQKITMIFGDSQIGKTAALKEYQRRNNHGETIYLDTPTTGAHGVLLHGLAKALGIPTQNQYKELKRRILESIDDRMLVIIDNVHRAFRGNVNARALMTFDFIQELYEATGCGIVLSMTNEGRDQLIKGTHAKRLEQIWKRRVSPLQLPLVTPEDDLARFAQAYGLDPAIDDTVSVRMSLYDPQSGKEIVRSHSDSPLRLQRKVNETEGLGVWITILQEASDLARENKRPISWGAVIKAHCISQAAAEPVK